ncbi:hypothetical protein BsWGS_15956 [Bradybaena similaris]
MIVRYTEVPVSGTEFCSRGDAIFRSPTSDSGKEEWKERERGREKLGQAARCQATPANLSGSDQTGTRCC